MWPFCFLGCFGPIPDLITGTAATAARWVSCLGSWSALKRGIRVQLEYDWGLNSPWIIQLFFVIWCTSNVAGFPENSSKEYLTGPIRGRNFWKAWDRRVNLSAPLSLGHGKCSRLTRMHKPDGTICAVWHVKHRRDVADSQALTVGVLGSFKINHPDSSESWVHRSGDG